MAEDGETRRRLERVGRRIRRARDARDLTRKALAEASGVSERFLATLESGTGNVSIARLREIAAPLGLRPGPPRSRR
ncbi:MAG: helix-turn-helix domain-containing protein [Spirochaetota bacterium]